MIDLRSDTVTRPDPAMRAAMAAAEVGDDVFGDDPTARHLEAMVAEGLGKEAALFLPSGTQANLVALLAHCGRGDEYLVGQTAHTYLFEGGGGAALGGIQPQPMAQEPDGTLDLAKVEALVKPDDPHFARTRLLCLENTTWGKVLPAGYAAEAGKVAARHGLAMHLDGARLFNAAVGSAVAAADLALPFDSVSLCLSKGLGAPAGSVLVGAADFVGVARRWRKVVGGGMRQAGVLAAAGIYALENNIDRLAVDHANAIRLAEGLAAWAEVEPVQTNMVFASFPAGSRAGLCAHLRNCEIQVLDGEPMRFVTHLDVDAGDIETVIETVGSFFG